MIQNDAADHYDGCLMAVRFGCQINKFSSGGSASNLIEIRRLLLLLNKQSALQSWTTFDLENK